MHIDPVYASKFMKPLLVGQVKDGALCHKVSHQINLFIPDGKVSVRHKVLLLQ